MTDLAAEGPDRTYPLHGTCDGCAGLKWIRVDDKTDDQYICAECDAVHDTAVYAFREALRRRGIPEQYLDAGVQAIDEYNQAYWDEATK